MSTSRNNHRRAFSPQIDNSIFHKTQLDKDKLENSGFLEYLGSKANETSNQVNLMSKHSGSKTNLKLYASPADSALISEANEYFKLHESRTNKIVSQYKKQIDQLRKKVNEITKVKVN